VRLTCGSSSGADIVFQVVVFRLLFKLSLRDLVRMFLMRGYEFTHEAVREWEQRFAPLLAEHLRRKRTGKMRSRWYVDETYGALSSVLLRRVKVPLVLG
jgi:putative transposase